MDLAIWAPEITDLHDSHEELKDLGVSFQPSPIRRLGPLMFQFGSIRAAVSSDVLILSLNIRFIDVLPAALIARARGSAVIFWGHGRSPRQAAWSTRFRDKIARLGHVYVLYNDIEAKALQLRGSFRGQIVVARNTIDTDAIRDGVTAPEQTIDSKPKIAFISRLYDAKRVDILLQAVHTASKMIGSSIGLEIVGDGPDRERLEGIAKKLEMADDVVWHGAIHDDLALKKILTGCVAFCMPEAAGLSAIHAMAHGVPIILNDDYRSNGPEYEILKPGVNGLSFKRGSIDDLASAIASLVSNPDMRMRLSTSAHETIISGRYNVRSMADSFSRAIEIAHSRARRFKGMASA